MSEAVVLITFNILIFVGAVSIFLVALPLRHKTAIRWLLLLTLSYCLISFSALHVYALGDFETQVFFSRLRLIGFALLAPSWLLFLSVNFQRWMWLQKPLVTALVFTPGWITIFLTLVPRLQDLVLRDFTPVEVAGLSVVSFSNGAWFPFHYLWAVILSLMLLSFCLVAFRSAKPLGRQQLALLFFGTSLVILIDIYCVVSDSPLRWAMLSGGMFFIHEIAIAYTAVRYRLLDPSSLAMEKVYLDFPDPVLVLDSDSLIRSFNHAAARVFGLTRSSRAHPVSYYFPSLPEKEGEYQHQEDSGQIWFFDVSTEIMISHGENSGKIVFFRDATRRRMNELQLGEQLEFKARLMSMLGHDLSAHLHSQANLSQKLGSEASAETRDVANMLTQSIFSTRDLMKNLMEWARTQEFSFKSSVKSFEFNALIEDVIEEVDTLSRQKSLALDFVSETRPFLYEGDSEMMASVIRNLLTNAIAASHPQGTVTIRLELGGGANHFNSRRSGRWLKPGQDK